MIPSLHKKIPIIVYLPSKYVIKLSVFPNTRFSDLFRSIPSKDIFYVFNGTILSNNQTFNSAGIKAGDSIVLVFKKNANQPQFYNNSSQYEKSNSFRVIQRRSDRNSNKKNDFDAENIDDNEEVRKWMRLTQDTETFNEKMRLIVNQDNARETARLKDILLSKIERKPRYFRKLCLAIKENQNIFDNCNSLFSSKKSTYYEQKNYSLVTDYAVNDEPSTEPLPIFFNQSDSDDMCAFEKNGDTIFSDTDSLSPALKP